MTYALLGGLFGLFGVLSWYTWRIRQDIDDLATRVTAVDTGSVWAEHAEVIDDQLASLVLRCDALEERNSEILLAVDHGIRHVDRAENRIRATIRRAREELEEVGVEHPGLEAEYRELRAIDGGGGPEAPVPPMSPDMGQVQSSVPGVPPELLRRVRGV